MSPPEGLWVSVDPGVRYYAAAYWRDTTLFTVGMLIVGERTNKLDLCVIEKPQVYAASNVRKRDIEDLLFSAGRIAGQHASVKAYLPAEWKGQVPKKVHHERIRNLLTADEKTCFEGFTNTELGHILDAVGLGLHHIGRK